MPWTLAFVLTIFPPLAAVNFFVGRKIVRALTELTSWNRKRVRQFAIGVHTFVNLLPVAYLLTYLVAGRASVPNFTGDNHIIDLLLSYPFWMSLVVFLQVFVLYVVLDFFDLSIIRFVPRFQNWWRNHEAALVVGILILVVDYSIPTIIRDTWTVRLVEADVQVENEFRGLDGLRIAQISDVQGDGRTSYGVLRRYVNKVNALKPDVVMFAGDLVTSGFQYIDSTAEILGHLKSRYGTFAALGDHDIFTDKEMVLHALKANRITAIEDSTVFLRIDSVNIALSFVTYTYSQRPRALQLERVTRETPGCYRVFLVHQPADNLVALAQKRGYQVLLAGHTHGGGVAFGVPGVFLLAPASFETKYLSGLYKVGQLVVSVTNGLGLTLCPIRFNAPAEIVLLTLRWSAH
jgi:predicted MPP superfamily phosphohydrolase